MIMVGDSENLVVAACDYCEKRTIDSLIHQTETGLLLCPDCCHYMETLPRGIEEDLERFLIGNVV